MSEPCNLRLYYNRGSEAPWVASIDRGTLASEVKARSITVKVVCESHYDPKAPEGHPTFWMACFGVLRVVDGRAVITAE